MHLILLCVLFSVVVSIELKLTLRKNFNLKQMIGFNYITASIACFYFLSPKMPQNLGDLSWPLFLALGVLLPSIFIIMGYAVKHLGIIKTDIAQRLSLFIPIVASFTLFNEPITFIKISGIVLAFIAIILLLYQTEKNNRSSRYLTGLLLFTIVLIGFGVIDILFKQVAKTGTDFSFNLMLSFIIAIIVMFCFILLDHQKLLLKNIIAGLLLGLFNFLNIYFYITAHQYYQQSPTLVFTTVNIGVIILGTFIGKIFFKEDLTTKNWWGIILAVLAIILLFRGEAIYQCINQFITKGI